MQEVTTIISRNFSGNWNEVLSVAELPYTGTQRVVMYVLFSVVQHTCYYELLNLTMKIIVLLNYVNWHANFSLKQDQVNTVVSSPTEWLHFAASKAWLKSTWLVFWLKAVVLAVNIWLGFFNSIKRLCSFAYGFTNLTIIIIYLCQCGHILPELCIYRLSMDHGTQLCLTLWNVQIYANLIMRASKLTATSIIISLLVAMTIFAWWHYM